MLKIKNLKEKIDYDLYYDEKMLSKKKVKYEDWRVSSCIPLSPTKAIKLNKLRCKGGSIENKFEGRAS